MSSSLLNDRKNSQEMLFKTLSSIRFEDEITSHPPRCISIEIGTDI